MLRALCLLVCFGALALGGCGGGGQDTATTTSQASVAKAPTRTTAKPKPKPQADTESAAKSSAPANAPGDPGDPSPGAKTPAAGVPVTEGDNSVQTFGSEGQETQREQATADLRAYLDARVAGEWAAACEAASAEYKRDLVKAVSRTPENARPKGCARTLEALYGEAPPETLEEAAQVGQVLSFRVRDDGYAYLIFKGAGGAVKFIAMANDGGTWRVNTYEPAAFEASQGEAQ